MLATVIASTTAKPSMTLPRNRNVGSFADIDRGHTRFDNPTLEPPSSSQESAEPGARAPGLVLKIRAEWIRAGKFASEPHAESMGFFSPYPPFLAHSCSP
jgi:hypothetical protein